MSYFLWHTIADTTGNWLAIHDEDKDDRYKPTFQFNYQMRSVPVEASKNKFHSQWPISRFIAGNPSVTYINGIEVFDRPLFEPFSVFNGGTYRPSFVVGSVSSPTGTPLSGAIVDLFLTSTNVLVYSGTTDAAGKFELPTPYAGQAHYIYANSGNTYTGASINTLIPNF